MALLRSPPRADAVLAGILLAYGLVEGVLQEATPIWLVVVVGLTLPLAWRRRFPAPVIGCVLGLLFLTGAGGYDIFESVLPLPLIVVCAYTAGREARSGRAALLSALGVGAFVAVGQEFAPPGDNSQAEDFVAVLVFVGGAAAAGYVMRVRGDENRRLEELTVQLAKERDLRARAAVAEERARVARELHDIVAHGVSLIAVQAGAAEKLIGRDEERARASLRAVQETARGALGEMRRLLTLLHPDGDVPGLAPQPGLADVARLVDQARSAGLPVVLTEDGARREMPAGINLSAYRIVQEALTNVRKHAGSAPTEVVVRYRSDEVLLEIANADAQAVGGGSSNGSERDRGHGLTGMGERARIYGGTLEVDSRDGRYVVRARLPFSDADG